jgi:hypothetical protein
MQEPVNIQGKYVSHCIIKRIGIKVKEPEGGIAYLIGIIKPPPSKGQRWGT